MDGPFQWLMLAHLPIPTPSAFLLLSLSPSLPSFPLELDPFSVALEL